MHEIIYKIVSQEIYNNILECETKNQNNENANYKLYIHIVSKELNNTDHDKYYVGITKRKVKVRWGKNGKNYTGLHIKNAINKYGWDNIEHIVITDKLLKDEAYEIEKSMIAYLHCNEKPYGYNISEGGDGGNRKPVCPVNQYDLDGNYIQSFECIADAARYIGCHRAYITHACKSHCKCHGYQWRYNWDTDVGFYRRKRQREVVQISTDGSQIINIFPSVAYIETQNFGLTASKIHTYMKNVTLIPLHDFYWIYKDDIINNSIKDNNVIKISRKEVEEYELHRKTG